MVMETNLKISFCTVCMNRLHHLMQTLPVNLEDNKSYKNVEFVLLDYNSTDGLEDWVKAELGEYIEAGTLVYYKTNEPTYFHRSHSRNMAFRLATGDVICNVDADNFTGKDFAQYINEKFAANNNIFIAADTLDRHYFIRDVFGRICFWKDDFYQVGGFDETMDGYGSEDLDLLNRLKALGREEVIIMDMGFLSAITHDDGERVQHEYVITKLQALYVSYINPSQSIMLFLFNDGLFNKGALQDLATLHSDKIPAADAILPDEVQQNDRYTLEEGDWTTGNWFDDEMKLYLERNGVTEEYTKLDNTLLTSSTHPSLQFFSITDFSMIVEAAYFHAKIKNMSKLKLNKNTALLNTNKESLGKGFVYKNFKTIDPIEVAQ